MSLGCRKSAMSYRWEQFPAPERMRRRQPL